MSKYKVVKDTNYTYFYSIYKQYFGMFWKYTGYVTAKSIGEAVIEAHSRINPPTVYFEA